jgi:HEAT repeat protein
LAHKDKGVRTSAAWLIGRIGSVQEASILVALLSDDDQFVYVAAASALAKIGGPQELIAMDARLATGDTSRTKHHVGFVKARRDILEKRLKSAEK